MLYPVKAIDIELSEPLQPIAALEGYVAVRGLVRLHGVPLGDIRVPVSLGQCSAAALGRAILKQQGRAVVRQLLANGTLLPGGLPDLKLTDLIALPPERESVGEWPLVTLAVCTRDRSEDLALCLEAIGRSNYPHLDVLVVDNAPQTEATHKLVTERYPWARYIREPRPGLDWARNRAILAAKGEIIAYTDDDVAVDPDWIEEIVRTFAENPKVMAVTGLVVPYELETEAQVLFEANGGFGKGFRRREYCRPAGRAVPWWMCGAGQYGTGANMAYRRAVFSQIGCFDPGLDVGTPTNGGGDLEMFFRVLQAGHILVYEPRAIVRHRHRRSYEKLKQQLTNNGIGLYSYLVRSARAYPSSILPLLYLGLYWFVVWNLKRAWIAYKYPTRIPAEIIWGELRGSIIGLFRYPQACKKVAEIVAKFGSQDADIAAFKEAYAKTATNDDRPSQEERLPAAPPEEIAVGRVALEALPQSLAQLSGHAPARIFVTWHADLLGHLDICDRAALRSPRLLAERIVEALEGPILSKVVGTRGDDSDPLAVAIAQLKQYWLGTEVESPVPLPDAVKVTVNIATYDRPDDLRNCLQCLRAQKTRREVEIVVVDNHPASGLTPPVVAKFPGVRLVCEPRQGLAYARNAGFIASTGEIIVATDDDVTVPPDWLEKLVAPFARADVGVVTGNVLPIQLETPSQQFFEQYGGLGKGYERLEADLEWFEASPRYAAPTWKLGATANAAFRATMLGHPEVGLMDEALGPGMPSGVGEDTYLFYKGIKAGYGLVYEPAAFVWHKHRREGAALRRQLYGYSKGHVCYNLTTWLRDGDWRGVYQILIGLSSYHLYRLAKSFARQSDYPLSLILLEILGNFAGPWSLWQSRLRVRREGKSSPEAASDRQMRVSSD